MKIGRKLRAVRRAWVVLVLASICVVAALVTGRDLYFHLAYLLLTVLIFSALWAWSVTRGLRLSRYTRTSRAQVGRSLEEHFSLRNTWWLPKPWVVVHDESELPGHHVGRVIQNLKAHQEYGWTVRTFCERRGRFRLGPISISSSDPLGLFEFRRELPQTDTIVVYPATVPVQNFPHPAGHLPGGNALRRRIHYITTNAAGVREYVPGDSFNRIHWASTARKDELIVKEFELDPLSDAWIFLDMERSAHFRIRPDEVELIKREREPWWKRMDKLRLEPSTEEYAVTAAASVAEFFIRRRRSVGLVAYGQRRQVIQADRDERQLSKILDTLAALRAVGNIPFAEVLHVEGRRLTRGTIAVAISASVREEWVETALFLDRVGLRIVVILVDSASFGGRVGADVLKERLLSTGTPVILLRRGDSLQDLLSSLPPPQRIPVLPPLYGVPKV
ncbi:MAG: DUF58 domain-containing protein [Chloroflexi bacterium]|nr:MAG: DUF58 domain-containing protein [Chloroflexota bacterium]